MEYLTGFIFTLFKIAMQAGLYAAATLWLAGLVASRHPTSVLKRSNYDGWQIWQRLFLVAYAALFLFSCTYWGDHGLGDSARIPLGHGEAIEELNGTETYFEAEIPLKLSTDQPFIDKFQVTDNVLCGLASDKSYFTYNLITKEQQLFADEQAYGAYATPRGLPPSSEFQTFWKHYKRFWGGWRFWLLA